MLAQSLAHSKRLTNVPITVWDDMLRMGLLGWPLPPSSSPLDPETALKIESG